MTDKLRWWATGLAGYALAGGALSLLGWVSNAPRLSDWLGIGIATQPNAAVATIAAGGALLAILSERRRLAVALGGLAALIGVTVLLEYLTGANPGFDALLRFGRTWGDAGVLAPGRMGPPGACSWSLLGAGLVLPASGPRGRATAPVLASVTLAISLLSLIGYLERSHARVYTAGSVDEALGVLERARPDIILCDIGMPGKDGYAFISELRRRHDATPALAVTAFARMEDKVRALRAGFHAHVAKPIEPAELLSTLAVFARGTKH